MRRTVLIAGASGVVGRAALEHFGACPDTRVIGLSRRAPDGLAGTCRHLPLDLDDAEACRAAVAELGEVTHLVYAALYEQPGLLAGWTDPEQMTRNLRMLQQLITPLLEAAPGLRHVSLLQGTKAYGAHIAPMKVPGREREPRVEHPNFYWLQQDWLTDTLAAAGIDWTIWRPPLILGHARGAPMDVITTLGVYGALRRARDEPLHYPGSAVSPGGANAVIDAVDARLLARAFDWAMDASAAAGEIFNITNGDVLSWRDAWPRIAKALGMAPGTAVTEPLAQWLPEQRDAWATLATAAGLRDPDLAVLLGDSPIYADVMLGFGRTAPAPPTFLSTIKLRQAGFADCVDTEDSIVAWLRTLQRQRILPQP